MITLNINGTNYNYPELDDEDWGEIATVAVDAIVDLTSGLRNPTAPLATVGVLRMGQVDRFAWRNANNDGNISLFLNNDVLYWTDGNTTVDLIASADGNVTGPANGATDNAVVRYDSTTGQLIKDSNAILDDLGTLALTGDLESVNVSASESITGNTLDINTATIDELTAINIAADLASLDVAEINTANLAVANISSVAISDGNITVDSLTTTNLSVTNLTVEDLTVNGDTVLGSNAADSLTINAGTASVTGAFSNEVIDEYTRTTGTSVALRGVAISNSSTTFSTTSGTFVDVTNLSVTITTIGRPVHIFLLSATTGDTSSILIARAAESATGFLKLVRDSTDLSSNELDITASGSGATLIDLLTPPGAIQYMDTPAAGTYTYKIQAKTSNSTTLGVRHCKLVAYEL